MRFYGPNPRGPCTNMAGQIWKPIDKNTFAAAKASIHHPTVASGAGVHVEPHSHANEQIINLRHPLVRLAGEIEWDFLAGRFSSVCGVGPGQPPLPTRLVAGLFILKHTHNLSDEALCDRWVENPYFQYFCGEVVFRHELPFDRSSLTRWRQRLGEEQIAALLQESLSVAHRSGAIATEDLERVAVDTTVQEKAVAHPTDARLSHRAIEKLVDLAKREGVELRQSYLRVAKRAAIMVGRYTHAHQF